MSCKFVIAEKPSVALAIADALFVKEKKDNYLEGGGWLISWCYGHLTELARPEAYNPDFVKWRREDLPIIPAKWQSVVDSKRRKQFDILRKLMERDDVETIVNACDAGREGELIFRTVYEAAGCTKPIQRLWISSMEDTAIREGFENLRPGEQYDTLYQAALCRSRADWLVGINATRLFTLIYGRTLKVGRVMTPTLAMLVQRESEIENFVPKPFYTVMLGLEGFSVTSGRLDDKSDAEKLCAACAAAGAVTVKSVEKKNRKEQPPALYDLTTLQREANRMLGFTAQQTLDYVQSLYEKKLCTYPRTDSRYLTADMEENLPEILGCVDKVTPFPFNAEMNFKQVICSEKVSDHHAIIPTKNIASTDLGTLPSGEHSVLQLIMARFLCSVNSPSEYAETTVVIECAGQLFNVKGRVTINPGWRSLDKKYRAIISGQTAYDKNNSLPELSERQSCNILSTEIKEGKTSPSAHFSEDSLLGAMETAGASEMPDDVERKGIGTPATRAAIIEKLIQSGLVERKKMKTSTRLLPTEQGAALASVLPEQLCSPLLTAEWEQKLKEVERGKMRPGTFMDEITANIRNLVETAKPSPDAERLFPDTRESIGKCPRCGRSVVEVKKGFVCTDRTCGFALWKENRFFTAKKKALNKQIAAALLKDGRVHLKGCYSEKTGKTYDATAILNDTGDKFVGFNIEFDKTGAAPK